MQSGDIKNIRYRSVLNLAKHCRFDEKHCRKIIELALPIFNSLKEKFNLPGEDLDLLEAAIFLHDIGHSISHSQHHRHSYYLIKNSELLGFNNEEIDIIANIARYHRKSHPKAKHIEYNKLSPGNKEKVRMLAGILRIADGLDRGHNSVVESIDISIGEKTFHIKVKPCGGKDPILEVWGANMRKELFEEAFGYSILIN